jgi:hypothetical protein
MTQVLSNCYYRYYILEKNTINDRLIDEIIKKKRKYILQY